MSRPDNILAAAVWALLAAVFFTGAVICVRLVVDNVPAIEIVFLRSLFGVLFMAPMLLRVGLAPLRTRRLPALGLRTLMQYLGMLTWYYALAFLPLGKAVALHFTLPLWGALFAMLLLRETMTARRWVGLFAGFAGALIILRPGMVPVGWPALIVLASAAFYGVSLTLVKDLSRTEPASTVVLYMNLLMVPMAVVPSLFVWVAPGWPDLALLFGLAVTTSLAHLCLTRAMAQAEATFVLPFDFLRLPFVSLAAYALFGETLDDLAWLGAAVILVATIYVTRQAVAANSARGS